MSSIRHIFQHYLLNMVHRSNLGSPRVQIVILVKLPISCDDYLQAYTTQLKFNIRLKGTLLKVYGTFFMAMKIHTKRIVRNPTENAPTLLIMWPKRDLAKYSYYNCSAPRPSKSKESGKKIQPQKPDSCSLKRWFCHLSLLT